ncbi:MAG: formate C-acetyltransferase/glycerol dehydratase family glycyl radical enzyme [Oscillibacter sp.]
MKVQHTKASGIHPFDHSYCLGYQVNHEDWSPFPRVNHLRKAFLDRPYDVDVDRMRLVTEAYKSHEDCSRKMQCAYAFESVLNSIPLYVNDEELILGEIAAPAKAAPIYPEFSINWLIDEVLHFPFEERAHDQFYIRNDEDRKEIVELAQYWKGKTVDDLINSRLTPDQLKGSEAGAKVYVTNDYHYAGVGHTEVDYAMLMKLGYNGIQDKAKAALADLHEGDADYAERHEFLTAMVMMLDSVKKYIERYAKVAEDAAEKTADPVRKQELVTMAANCHQIAGGAPQTFWQAIQLFNLATTLIQIEGNGHSISYGRMDQWLNPFYEADMKKGTISKEFALELIEDQYVKMNNPTKLKDKSTVVVRNGRGFGGESLVIGGVDRDGNDATNDLTMLMIEACAHTRMMNPWLCVRMHENTPYELKIKTVECIRAGFGHPKIFNDASAIRAMLRKGHTLEEARDYSVVGCVEPNLPGKENGWHGAGYINVAKIVELALNNGHLMHNDEQIGLDTGSLATYENFEEILSAIDTQFAYWCEQIRGSNDVIDVAHKECKPLPYISSMFEDCITSGKCITEGGAKYNFTSPQAAGIGTCADILATIKQLVFEEKKVTGAQLLQAVMDNWEGHDKLYALVNSSKVHHYGNDDDYADELFNFVYESFCRNLNVGVNPRGGTYNPGVYTVNANVGLGLATNASIDGRKGGEPLSDNMGPVHTMGGSHDVSGPTALVNSVAKADHSLATNGTLLNIRFPEDAVSGPEGRDNLVSFVDTYLEKNGMHVQFNIMSADKMKDAQKKPENYKDMLVRVAGYSAYFVELGKPLQDDLIDRTEFRF